ncbi:DUF5677 domain-containing protein [Constantimarinum sp. W242]|uniref:DUF5677 domain-containing protein n=1 Tax=Patiriisocius hiemis TaxID=3075604 RepID=A0ABU2YBM2_9FLAO|nr:DUF5677 domain-containing protein [Constantimarinum sp. W242]MDT0555266.1 DUF5677 domain-containing protein [Constantimarinum sp. W242]
MKPLDDLLPLERDPYLIKVQNHFSDLLNQVIYYGTNIVELDTKVKREGKDNNVPTLFLRNILEISDSISILIRNSSIEPSKILLRSLIENSLSLAYMLEKNEKQRALS